MICKVNLSDIVNEEVIIFGAGVFGKKLVNILKNIDCSGIKYIIDNDTYKINSKLEGIEVISPKTVEANWLEKAIFIIAREDNWRGMYNELIAMNVKKDRIYLFSGGKELFNVENVDELERFVRMILRKRPNETLWFDYHVVEHCNLNCAGCLHFSSISRPEFADLDVFKKNMLRIREIFGDRVERIILLGGEPLLHPEISKFIKASKEIIENINIKLVTNGLLLNKMDDEFFKCIRETDTEIAISEYPVKIKYETIYDFLKEQNVWFSHDDKYNWGKLCLDIEGKNNYKESFYYCPMSNTCITLDSAGRLFTCPPGAHMHHFIDEFNVPVSICEGDYIDIYKENNPDVILEHLSTPKPMCRYCSKPSIQPSKWSTTKRDICEWT